MSRADPLWARVRDAVKTRKTILCCGLDPDPDKVGLELGQPSNDAVIVDFLKTAVDLTIDLVAAYKIQRAYFDLMEQGKAALIEVVEYVRRKDEGVPVILDAKVGDTGNTMTAIMEYLRNDIRPDGVVVNPFMGDEVFAAFRGHGSPGGVVMVRTSNAGAGLLQDLQVGGGGQALWERILELVIAEWKAGADVLPVISSTMPSERASTLDTIPSGLPVFIAGYGAQGGDLKSVASLRIGDRPMLVNSSRAILFSGQRASGSWKDGIRHRALSARDELDRWRKSRSA